MVQGLCADYIYIVVMSYILVMVNYVLLYPNESKGIISPDSCYSAGKKKIKASKTV
jgi:hypothetical protein